MTKLVNGRAPPGIKRGPGRGLAENNIGNGNAQLNNPPRPVLQARRASEARRLRRQRYAARIWPLGHRVLFELVDHIAGRFDLEDEVDRLLDRFAGLDSAVLRVLGGDRIPSIPPPRLVGGRQ
jgi:hypothetical protein